MELIPEETEVSPVMATYEDIMEAVPEKCQSCFKPKSFALQQAHLAEETPSDVEAIKTRLAENLRWRCVGGTAVIKSCMNTTFICGFKPYRSIPTDQRLLDLPD